MQVGCGKKTQKKAKVHTLSDVTVAAPPPLANPEAARAPYTLYWYYLGVITVQPHPNSGQSEAKPGSHIKRGGGKNMTGKRK